jgi:hypothetical protein
LFYIIFLIIKDETIVLFVNPKSGSEEGKFFVEVFTKNNTSCNKNFKILELKQEETNIKILLFEIISKQDFLRGADFINYYLSGKK